MIASVEGNDDKVEISIVFVVVVGPEVDGDEVPGVDGVDVLTLETVSVEAVLVVGGVDVVMLETVSVEAVDAVLVVDGVAVVELTVSETVDVEMGAIVCSLHAPHVNGQ